MDFNLQPFYLFLQQVILKHQLKKGKGRPKVYSDASMILFFMIASFKKIHHFKTMETYLKVHHKKFGWDKAPCRKTLRRRFLELTKVLEHLMPKIALEALELGCIEKPHISFCDKSIFTAFKGYVWHRKQKEQGIVPSKRIDTEASWAKSAYHSWRFGYGLTIISSVNRFPLNACVATASASEIKQVSTLLKPLKDLIYILIGDGAYHSIRFITNIYKSFKIQILSPSAFVKTNRFTAHYNSLWKDHSIVRELYKQRKSSIEPVFSLIKGLFGLEWTSPLPYKGLSKVKPYLLLLTLTIQLMMIQNSAKGNNLCDTTDFKTLFN